MQGTGHGAGAHAYTKTLTSLCSTDRQSESEVMCILTCEQMGHVATNVVCTDCPSHFFCLEDRFFWFCLEFNLLPGPETKVLVWGWREHYAGCNSEC